MIFHFHLSIDFLMPLHESNTTAIRITAAGYCCRSTDIFYCAFNFVMAFWYLDLHNIGIKTTPPFKGIFTHLSFCKTLTTFPFKNLKGFRVFILPCKFKFAKHSTCHSDYSLLTAEVQSPLGDWYLHSGSFYCVHTTSSLVATKQGLKQQWKQESNP